MSEHLEHPDQSDPSNAGLAALRARYARALPDVPVDPAPIVRRARRRRTLTRAGAGAGALALVAAIAVGGTALREAPERPPATSPAPDTATPPPEDVAEIRLWLTAEQVPPGAELGVGFVTGDQRALFDTLAELDRWDGDRWVEVREVDLCPAAWQCPQGQYADAMGPYVWDVVGGPGLLGRFETDGLANGWYRLTAVSVQDQTARGQFEVADGAPLPAPLPDPHEPSLALAYPSAVTFYAQQEAWIRVVARSADDAAAAAAEIAAGGDTIDVQRWDGTRWSSVATTGPRVYEWLDRSPGSVLVRLPLLPAGTYRLVTSTGLGELTGSYWVTGSGPADLQPVTVLEWYYGDAPPDAPPPAGDVMWNAGWNGAIVRMASRTIDVWTTNHGAALSWIGVEDGVVVVYVDDASPLLGSIFEPHTTTWAIALPEGVDGDEAPRVEIRSTTTGEVIGTSVEGRADHWCDLDGGFVCAANAWLDDLIARAGYTPWEPPGGRPPEREVAVGSAVDVDASIYDVEMTIVHVDSERRNGVVSEEWRSDIGQVTLRYGRSEDTTVTAAITCGAYEIRLRAYDETRFWVKPVSEAVAAHVDFCPADLDELLERYQDW